MQSISQKICHDLATPVGAIRLGLENLPENEFTPILLQSIDNATHRIEIFRTLFSLSTDSLDSERVGRLLKAYLGSKNTEFSHSGETRGEYARYLLGLGVVMSEALPRGGTVHCDFDNLSLSCQGPILHMPYENFDLESIVKENLQFKSGIILFHILTLMEYDQVHLDVKHHDHRITFEINWKKTA